MLARKLIEHWYLWIVINSVSVGLYIYKDLNVTAVLFTVYFIFSFVGYFKWRKSLEMVTDKQN
jgi:nicotinamide mononucleotide transporter